MAKAVALPYFTISAKELKRATTLVGTAVKGVKAIQEYERYVLITGDVAAQTLGFRISHSGGGMRNTLNSDGVLTTKELLNVCEDFECAFLIEDLIILAAALNGVVEFRHSKIDDSMFVTDQQIETELRHAPTVARQFPDDVSDRFPKQLSFDAADFDRRMRLAMGSANEKLPLHKYGALYLGLFGEELFLASFDPTRGLSSMRYAPQGLEVTGEALTYIVSGSGAETVIRALGGYSGRVAIHGSAGSGQVGFVFGGTAIFCRLFEPPFLDLRIVDALQVETDATISREAFSGILDLIGKTAEKGEVGRARIAFSPKGLVAVSALGRVAALRSKMSGMASGALPASVDVQSARVKAIADDLKGDLVHIGVVKDRGWLHISSPGEVGYNHFSSNLIAKEEARFEEDFAEAA